MNNRILPGLAALILMLAGLAAPAAAQVAQNITPIAPPNPGDSFRPKAINDSGVVVGTGTRAWTWSPVDGWREIGDPGSVQEAINNRGQVVGWGISADETHNVGVFYDPTTGWRLMDGFGNNGVFPAAINDNGLVVGSSWLGEFTWTEANAPTILPAGFSASAVNNSGVVAGAFAVVGSPAQEAAKWDASGVTLLGGQSRVLAINNGGMMAGYSYVGHTPLATVWSAAGVLVLNAFGSYYDWSCECEWEQSVAYGINDSGQVVGMATKADATEAAFIWDAVNGMRELFPAALYPYSTARDINNSGQIVASYFDGGVFRGLYGTVAPPAPPTPQGQTEVVADDIAALVASGELSAGDANAIDKALDQAIDALDRGNTTAAGNQLNAAVNKVKALVNSGRLSAVHGNALKAALGTIIASL